MGSIDPVSYHIRSARRWTSIDPAVFAMSAVVVAGARCGGHGSVGNPAGTFGDPTPAFLPEQALRACVLAEACVSPPLASRGGDCVYRLERGHITPPGDLEAFADCARQAKDCTEALTCVSHGHGPTYCAAYPGNSCDGDLAVGCPVGTASPGWASTVSDCAALGMKCIQAGYCSDGNACSGPIVLTCLGSRLTSCVLLAKIQSSVDCATVYPGGRCGAFNEDLQCLPQVSELCPESTEIARGCSGNVLLGCDGPRASKLDCSALASDCVVDNFGRADCVARAQECTSSSPDLCHGSAISICVDGRYQDVDCASLGLGPCQATVDGAACGGPML